MDLRLWRRAGANAGRVIRVAEPRSEATGRQAPRAHAYLFWCKSAAGDQNRGPL